MNASAKEPVKVEGDMLELLARVYAAGLRSGAASAMASAMHQQGRDTRSSEVSAVINMVSTSLRDMFEQTFAGDPTLRHELVAEWELFAADVAFDTHRGGGSS